MKTRQFALIVAGAISLLCTSAAIAEDSVPPTIALPDNAASTDTEWHYTVGELLANVPWDQQTYRFFDALDAAEMGDPEAALIVGTALYWGDGVRVDSAESEKWLKVAAAAKRPGAEAMLGRLCLATGRLEEAVQRLRDAVNSGDPAAEEALAEAYFAGVGVPQDDLEAYRLFDLAAGHGLTYAKYSLAILNELLGRHEKAFHLFLDAANDGLPEAMYYVGMAYRAGEFVPEDHELAFKLISRGADSGLASAAFLLGQLYQEGEGTKQDNYLAYVWYRRAILNGSRDSANRANQVSALLSPEELALAEDEARNWYMPPPDVLH